MFVTASQGGRPVGELMTSHKTTFKEERHKDGENTVQIYSRGLAEWVVVSNICPELLETNYFKNKCPQRLQLMVNLLDMMVPLRSGSHRDVHPPGSVSYPAVTWNKWRKGLWCLSVKMSACSGFGNPFLKAMSAFRSFFSRVPSLDSWHDCTIRTRGWCVCFIMNPSEVNSWEIGHLQC